MDQLDQLGVKVFDGFLVRKDPVPTYVVEFLLGRSAFTTDQWRDFLIRSIGLEPTALNERAKMVVLLRMAPFVERNFNLVELGPRGTVKSHLFQQISPYSQRIPGGEATVAKMFVNNGNGQRGLVCQYDVVCFDEVVGVSIDQKDGALQPPGVCLSPSLLFEQLRWSLHRRR